MKASTRKHAPIFYLLSPKIMPSIAITGGIACGKSYVTGLLATILNTKPFDADAEVTKLLEQDPEVTSEIEAAFGDAVFDNEKKIIRSELRSLMIKSPQNKKNLEAILHPRLKKKWEPLAIESLTQTNSTFLAEIPLLYENDLDVFFNCIIVLASSQQVQLHRLIHERKLPRDIALSMLHLQHPLNEKIARADIVIWNDGKKEIVEQQVRLWLRQGCRLQPIGYRL